MAAEQFVITPRPPVRAFALAAGTALAGAGLTILPLEGAARTAMLVVGLVLVVVAVALVVVALTAVRRNRVVVALDADGYRVDSPAGVRVGRWADVTRVTAAPGRLTLHSGETERVHLVTPAGPTPQLETIARAISKRLDDSRGYQTWQG